MNLLIGQLMDAIRCPSPNGRFAPWSVREDGTIVRARQREALIERRSHQAKESQADE
jgi:hypothetical protein